MNDMCRTIAQCLQIAAEARAKTQGLTDDNGLVWAVVGLAVLPQLVGLFAMGLTYWWADGGSLPRLIITRRRVRG